MKTAKNFSIYKLLAIVAIPLLVALDQWTKLLARQNLKDGPFVIWDGVFEFLYSENRGAVWGFAQGSVTILILLSILIFLAVLVIYIKLPSNKHYLPLNILSVLIMAGAIGNLIDRIFLHYVTDFLYIKLINFPIFNVADCYVTLSAILVLILAFTVYRKDDWDFLSFGKSDQSQKQIPHDDADQ